MEQVVEIYHNTRQETKVLIQNSGILNNPTNFCCTLIEGDLPHAAPRDFGTERIILPIAYVVSLFQQPTLFLREPIQRTRKRYINLGLIENVDYHGEPLNFENNDFLRRNAQTNTFQVMAYQIPRERNFLNWVNLRVYKAIPLIPFRWETVPLY